jgi:hypothetical protein
MAVVNDGSRGLRIDCHSSQWRETEEESALVAEGEMAKTFREASRECLLTASEEGVAKPMG